MLVSAAFGLTRPSMPGSVTKPSTKLVGRGRKWEDRTASAVENGWTSEAGGKDSMDAGFGRGTTPVMPVKPIKPVKLTKPTKSSSGFRLRRSLDRNSVGSICFLAAACGLNQLGLNHLRPQSALVVHLRNRAALELFAHHRLRRPPNRNRLVGQE
jgi:hypothetical protein